MISEKYPRVIENLTEIFDGTIYRKKEILVDIEQVHRDLFYIKKGVVRIFYYDDKAKDQTHWISSDGSFIGLFSSILCAIRNRSD